MTPVGSGGNDLQANTNRLCARCEYKLTVYHFNNKSLAGWHRAKRTGCLCRKCEAGCATSESKGAPGGIINILRGDWLRGRIGDHHWRRRLSGCRIRLHHKTSQYQQHCPEKALTRSVHGILPAKYFGVG